MGQTLVYCASGQWMEQKEHTSYSGLQQICYTAREQKTGMLWANHWEFDAVTETHNPLVRVSLLENIKIILSYSVSP